MRKGAPPPEGGGVPSRYLLRIVSFKTGEARPEGLRQRRPDGIVVRLHGLDHGALLVEEHGASRRPFRGKPNDEGARGQSIARPVARVDDAAYDSPRDNVPERGAAQLGLDQHVGRLVAGQADVGPEMILAAELELARRRAGLPVAELHGRMRGPSVRFIRSMGAVHDGGAPAKGSCRGRSQQRDQFLHVNPPYVQGDRRITR